MPALVAGIHAVVRNNYAELRVRFYKDAAAARRGMTGQARP
jgi:hypothetical protein